MNAEVGIINKLVRSYTFNTPIRKGGYRLADLSLRLGGELPPEIIAKTQDGRKLWVNPEDLGYRYLYFFGEYESAISHFVTRSVSEGDVCLDLGANLGWFTTLLQGIVGSTGFVHAFEPVPMTFDRLKRNILLNNNSQNVKANRIALGESVGEIEMIVDASEPDGHASVAFNKGDFSGSAVKAELSTLDIYLKQNESREIAFLKADIEGSELPMLKGGLRLFEQEHAPIMEIEMARNTSLRFGYEPNDLISFINARRSYEYYRIDEFKRSLIRFEEFGKDDIGANVLCIPQELPLERRQRIGIGV